MRLIDADAFVKRFNNLCETDTDKQIACVLMGAIASELTAYDIDKVVEELESIECASGAYERKCWLDKAIEIVKQGVR